MFIQSAQQINKVFNLNSVNNNYTNSTLLVVCGKASELPDFKQCMQKFISFHIFIICVALIECKFHLFNVNLCKVQNFLYVLCRTHKLLAY